MCPPAPIEDSPFVAQNEVDTPRLEPVAVAAGLITFALVLGTALFLYLIEFRVDGTTQKGIGYASLLAFLVWFRMTTPTSRLTPTQRGYRARRRIYSLLGFLCGVSVLLSILAANSLHTWQDWVRLAFSLTFPLIFLPLIHVRFTMGTGR